MVAGALILGAGHAGVETAIALRKAGYEAAINLVGDELSLPYHKPPLSKAFLKNIDQAPQVLRPETFYQDKQIDLRLGVRADRIDLNENRVYLDVGEAIDFSYLVLALGARARRLSLPGETLGNVFYLRDLAQAEALREACMRAQSIGVIGGGFIGLEVAASLAALGKRVCVLEAATRILGRAVAPAISEHMQAWHRSLGVDIRTNISITHLEGDHGSVEAICLQTNERLCVDLVIIGAGAVPETALAQQAGLACDNGICTDEFLLSRAPNIFAIGDCASYPHWQAGRIVRLESVQNATDQARHVAKHIVGQALTPYREVPWFWSDQGGIKLQMAGLSFDPDQFIMSGSPQDNRFSVWHFRNKTLLSVDSVNHAPDHMLARKLLAAGISPSPEQIAQGAGALKALL